MIATIKGSLFDAPKGSILMHACNCRGVWGSGIAKTFSERFPKAYNAYAYECLRKGSLLLGTCFLIPDTDYAIACLFTSENYGRCVDSPDQILASTRKAVNDLIKQNVSNKPLHTCKINSGMFNVSWKDTESILEATGIDFTVYDF